MSHSRTNPGGWSSNAEMTSAQANDLDVKSTQVLDKRAGETDTLESVVSCAGAGRIIGSYAAGADADTAYQLSGGNSIIDASSGLTAARTYTLSTTGAVAGDKVEVKGGAFDVTVKVGSNTLAVVGEGNSGLNHSRSAVFLFNGTTWILWSSSWSPEQRRVTFTADGDYTVPADVYKLLVLGSGAGGGGGGGGGGSTTGTHRPGGGGAGGAAPLGAAVVDVTPGQVIAVTVGVGGSGGGPGSPGVDGGASTFGSLVTFRGGQGGSAGIAGATATTSTYYGPGGGSLAGGTKRPASTTFYGVVIPGEGGYGGQASNAATDGAPAASSATVGGSGTTSGGTAGATGTADGSTLGGGGGGGGGASAFGNGGAGGAGGNGNNTNATPPGGTNGSAGGTAAGGGGGGGGGNNTAGGGGGAGGTGGAGGNGAIVIIPIR